MIEKCCCFTGHRIFRTPEDVLRTRLQEAISRLVAQGVTTFCAGGARGFDLLAEETVLSAKSQHSELKLVLYLPFPGHSKKWTEAEQLRQEAVYEQAADLHYAGSHYFRGCMHKRNRQLVAQSQFCICCLERDTGGTAFTVSYAKKKGLTIYNLAVPEDESPNVKIT